jgi:hypothetical protein
MANAAAGHVVRIQDDGTYSITTNKGPTNSGTNSGFIWFVGYANQNGANSNGGRPIIDAQSNSITALGDASKSRIAFENLKVINAATAGMAVGDYSIAYNIQATACGDGIVGGTGSTVSRVIGCECWSNTINGIKMVYAGQVLFNHCYLNTNYGILNSGQLMACAFNTVHNNTAGGIYEGSYLHCYLFNTIYANGSGKKGLFLDHVGGTAIGNLVSGQTGTGGIGINVGINGLALHNHFYNNTANTDTNPAIAGTTTGDPAFINTGTYDFGLGDLSAAINLEIGSPMVRNPFMDRGAVQKQVVASTTPVRAMAMRAGGRL